MKTKKSLSNSFASCQADSVQKFLVLVPHRDTRQTLRKYSEEQINNGLKGVYPFPLVAVLKELDHPLAADELKQYARKLREEMGDSKFEGLGAGSDILKIGEYKYKLYGTKFIAQRREDAKNAEIIVGIFLSINNDLPLPNLKEISFRAAAVANMYIKPIKEGFKYKIGKLCWLPKRVT